MQLMMYYKAHITYGSKFKKKQRERTLFVQTADTVAPANVVLGIIRKISFAKWHSVQQISHEEYIRGVSRSRG